MATHSNKRMTSMKISAVNVSKQRDTCGVGYLCRFDCLIPLTVLSRLRDFSSFRSL